MEPRQTAWVKASDGTWKPVHTIPSNYTGKVFLDYCHRKGYVVGEQPSSDSVLVLAPLTPEVTPMRRNYSPHFHSFKNRAAEQERKAEQRAASAPVRKRSTPSEGEVR
jgi:hypothetical protein